MNVVDYMNTLDCAAEELKDLGNCFSDKHLFSKQNKIHCKIHVNENKRTRLVKKNKTFSDLKNSSHHLNLQKN